MDTNIYRYIYETAKCRSISAAARKLFISQPALTKQIARLEAQLGVKLFDRDTGHLRPTPAGEIFLEFSEHYLVLEQEMLEKLGKAKHSGESAVLVATTHRGGSYVGKYTPAFLASCPDASLEYIDLSASDCESALENETAELAVYTDPVLSDQLEYLPLEEDPLVLLVPKDSVLLAGKDLSGYNAISPLELDPEELKNPSLTWLLSTQRHSLYYAEQSFFKRFHIAPIHTLTVDYVDTRCSIANSGGGIALLPALTVSHRTAGNCQAICCTVRQNSLYRYVVIAKKRGRALSPCAERFWRFMVTQKLHPHSEME